MANISRRKALGLLAAVSLPPTAVVAASPIIDNQPRADALADLIKEYDNVVELIHVQTTFIVSMDDDPACPPYGIVTSRELGLDHRRLGDPISLASEPGIDAYIDELVARSQWHIDHGITPDGHRNRIARIEADRLTAKRLLADRNKTYRAWEESSGVAAAEREENRLSELSNEMHERIISWQCETIEEVRLVARYAANEDYSSEIALEAIKNLAGVRT